MTKWRGTERRLRERAGNYWHGGRWVPDATVAGVVGLVLGALALFGPVAAVLVCTVLLAGVIGVVVAQLHESTGPGVAAAAGVIALGVLVGAALR